MMWAVVSRASSEAATRRTPGSRTASGWSPSSTRRRPGPVRSSRCRRGTGPSACGSSTPRCWGRTRRWWTRASSTLPRRSRRRPGSCPRRMCCPRWPCRATRGRRTSDLSGKPRRRRMRRRCTGSPGRFLRSAGCSARHCPTCTAGLRHMRPAGHRHLDSCRAARAPCTRCHWGGDSWARARRRHPRSTIRCLRSRSRSRRSSCHSTSHCSTRSSCHSSRQRSCPSSTSSRRHRRRAGRGSARRTPTAQPPRPSLPARDACPTSRSERQESN